MSGSRVADAVAELAYRTYQERVARGEYKANTAPQGWAFLSTSEQLRLIKAAHQTLDMMKPTRRMPMITELSDSWRARPRNQMRADGTYPSDHQGLEVNHGEAGDNLVADADGEAG